MLSFWSDKWSDIDKEGHLKEAHKSLSSPKGIDFYKGILLFQVSNA